MTFLVIVAVFWAIAGAVLLTVAIWKVSHVVEQIDDRINPIAYDLRELKQTKANRKVYVKVGDAWIIRKKRGGPYVFGSPYYYTAGAKHDRVEFSGDEVNTANDLANEYHGELIDVEEMK